MSPTSHSLLERLQQQDDPGDWDRLVTAYEPWLRAWLGRHQLQPADVDDLVQNILTVVSQKLPTFVHSQRPGAFRAWLKVILIHQVKYFLRSRRNRQALAGRSLSDELDRLEDPASDASRRWDLEHDRHLVRRLLAAVKPEFQPRTWELFRMLVLEDRPVAEVADLFQIQRNAVYVAKARVLARLRQELHGLAEW